MHIFFKERQTDREIERERERETERGLFYMRIIVLGLIVKREFHQLRTDSLTQFHSEFHTTQNIILSL